MEKSFSRGPDFNRVVLASCSARTTCSANMIQLVCALYVAKSALLKYLTLFEQECLEWSASLSSHLFTICAPFLSRFRIARKPLPDPAGNRGFALEQNQGFFSYIGQIFLLANILLFPFGKDKLSIGSFWRLFIGTVFAMIFQYKPIKKESVVIMPSFGVQLETHFWSGRIDRKFIPMGKIIKPVLNECVTPITCYWSLALILHDEDQLTLIFQKSQPPLKILVPVWRALCKATNLEDISHSLNSSTKSH